MRKALDADEDAGHRNRKARGAAAPVQQYDRVKAEGGRAASLPQSASLTAPSSEGAFGVRCGFASDFGELVQCYRSGRSMCTV